MRDKASMREKTAPFVFGRCRLLLLLPLDLDLRPERLGQLATPPLKGFLPKDTTIGERVHAHASARLHTCNECNVVQ